MRLLWVWVGLAGAIGALARFGIGTWVGPREFPWATFGINVTGCLFFGFVWALQPSPEVRAILLAGFAGAFTTFSTFIFDLVEMGTAARWQPFLLSGLGQLTLGTLAMLLGLRLGRLF